jgi:hypothetical protein
VWRAKRATLPRQSFFGGLLVGHLLGSSPSLCGVGVPPAQTGKLPGMAIPMPNDPLVCLTAANFEGRSIQPGRIAFPHPWTGERPFVPIHPPIPYGRTSARLCRCRKGHPYPSTHPRFGYRDSADLTVEASPQRASTLSRQPYAPPCRWREILAGTLRRQKVDLM